MVMALVMQRGTRNQDRLRKSEKDRGKKTAKEEGEAEDAPEDNHITSFASTRRRNSIRNICFRAMRHCDTPSPTNHWLQGGADFLQMSRGMAVTKRKYNLFCGHRGIT